MKVNFISYLAEYFATFFFILVVFASSGNPIVIGAGLALGIFLSNSLSGGNLNPAVSLAMYINGSLTPIDLFGYVFVQLLGGVSAYYAHRVL